MTGEIEKKYSELGKKHRLPDFKELDDELEMSDCEKTNFLLRDIIRRIAERLDFYTTMLEEVMQPDTKLYAMHEARFFDDTEKKEMYSIYTNLMKLNRKIIELSLKKNEKEDAEFISSFFSEWKGLKLQLLNIAVKMKECWKEESEMKEDVGYLG